MGLCCLTVWMVYRTAISGVCNRRKIGRPRFPPLHIPVYAFRSVYFDLPMHAPCMSRTIYRIQTAQKATYYKGI